MRIAEELLNIIYCFDRLLIDLAIVEEVSRVARAFLWVELSDIQV